ncbi:MAG: hypothetical protein AAF439_10610 [Pseudomonadota bacterium]
MALNCIIRAISRGLLVPGFLAFFTLPAMAAADLPKDPEAVMSYIRTAIDQKDYEAFKKLVFWKDAGKIKKRIVRFHLSRSLGRKIKSITWEEFPEDGLQAHIDTGKMAPNMEMTNAVRVVFDEAPINDEGKMPTAVYLVGKRDGVFRIGLVNRTGFDDDDD